MKIKTQYLSNLQISRISRLKYILNIFNLAVSLIFLLTRYCFLSNILRLSDTSLVAFFLTVFCHCKMLFNFFFIYFQTCLLSCSLKRIFSGPFNIRFCITLTIKQISAGHCFFFYVPCCRRIDIIHLCQWFFSV